MSEAASSAEFEAPVLDYDDAAAASPDDRGSLTATLTRSTGAPLEHPLPPPDAGPEALTAHALASLCVVLASYAQGDGAIGVALRAGAGGALVDVDMTELVHPKNERSYASLLDGAQAKARAALRVSQGGPGTPGDRVAITPPHARRIQLEIVQPAGAGAPPPASKSDAAPALRFGVGAGAGAGDGLQTWADYCGAVFTPGTVSSMLGAWRSVLRLSLAGGGGAHAGTTLDRVELLDGGARDRLVRGFNDTAHRFAGAGAALPGTLHAIFEDRARAHPTAPAVDCGGVVTTYGELDRGADRLATHLRGRLSSATGGGAGAGAAPIVALFLERSAEVYLAMLAAMKMGGSYCALDPEYPPDRVAYALENSAASALVTTTALRRVLGDVVPAYCQVVLLDEIDDGPQSRPGSAPSPPDRSPGHADVPPEARCYVIYTSGSTGRPKGVQISHREACNLVRAEALVYQLSPADRVLQGFSTSFDASVEEIWMAFYAGATLVVGTKELMLSGPDLPAKLESMKVTAFSTVPTLLACLDPASAPSLRLIIVGGEACAQSVVDAWAPGRRFFNTYGPTEATVVATFHKCEPGLARGERMKIGRPLANVQCYVLDDRLSPVPQGALGELYIGGVGVSSRGYLGLPAMTAERFVPDPFVGDAGGDGRALLYKTGDLVRQAFVSLRILRGTPFLPWYYRMMGASIGRNVFMNTAINAEGFDLISIGDNVSLNTDVRIKCSIIQDRVLILRPIVIGAGCTIGVRSVIEAGAVLCEGTQVGNMTLIPMGMETAPYQIWEGSPCQFRGVAAPNPEHHPDSAAPRQGFTLGTWAPEPNPALPDHRRGDAVVAAAHASTVVEVAGADADRATGKATPWREAGSPLPVSRQASAPDMRGRKVRPLFGRLVPCLQLLGIVFASLLTVVSYLPFIEAFLFSVKANPGSLVSAALGLEVIAPERICGAESSGALVTTPNATRPCVFPFTFPASHPGNADRWGRNRGSIREFTQCSAVACGGDPAGGRPVYRCCATAAVWAEDAWAECLSCPNTASPTEEANLKYLGFVVLLELTLGAFIVFPILFTVILMVLRPCLLIGLRGTRTFPVSSFAYFRRWMLDLLMDEAYLFAHAWHGTWFLPHWMWLLGARMGRNIEMSSTLHVAPEGLRVADGSFIADSVVAGAPFVHAGSARTGDVELGRHSFVGNGSTMPAGAALPDGVLVGLMSVAPRCDDPAAPLRPHTTWLGTPAINLLAREGDRTGTDDRMTYRPRWWRVVARATFELLGYLYLALAYATVFAVTISVLELAYAGIAEGGDPATYGARVLLFALLVPLLRFVAGALACAIVLVTKWVVIGRFKPGNFPLWSLYVWRTELVERLEENLAEPLLVNLLWGTVWIRVWYRLLGASIGKRAYISGAIITEPDLVRIGDDVTLEDGCTVQAHLFQDRIRACGPVRIGDRCSLGSNSVILLGGEMGDRATLNALSLLMREESLPPKTHWVGIPAQRAASHPQWDFFRGD